MTFSPKESWTNKLLDIPSAKKGKLKLLGEYEEGLTWRIDKNNVWKSYFNKLSGWYCIGDYVIIKDDI